MKNACPKCHHLQEENKEHVCPSPEYLAWHRNMIHEAALHDGQFNSEFDSEEQPFMVSIPPDIWSEIKQNLTPA
jgi:hypothetical protein